MMNIKKLKSSLEHIYIKLRNVIPKIHDTRTDELSMANTCYAHWPMGVDKIDGEYKICLGLKQILFDMFTTMGQPVIGFHGYFIWLDLVRVYHIKI